MFVGHYSAALAAKAAQPRAPLWTYVAAAQLIDIGWSGLVILGVEKMRINPALPGSALDLYYMPFTHSLPAALIWSLAAAVLARWLLKLPWTAALMIGLTVASHWVADLIVHRPDLIVWFGRPKVGLGFWNHPVAEMALELGLVAVAGAAWTAQRKGDRRTAWPALVFIAGLTALQIYAALQPPPPGPVAMARTALMAYLAVTAIAWLIDQRGFRKS